MRIMAANRWESNALSHDFKVSELAIEVQWQAQNNL